MSLFGGKGGGKGYDTSALEDATNKSLELQKRMYDEGVSRSMPWYKTGVSSQQRIADLMGLSGGSQKTKSQLYDEMKGQYTTTPETKTDMYIDPSGNVKSKSGAFADFMNDRRRARPDLAPYANATAEEANRYMNSGISSGEKDLFNTWMGEKGYNPYSTNKSTVDNAALNSAVNDAYENQQTPSDFGALTEAFGLEKFKQDPSYDFRKAEGEKALERAYAARGQTFTPEAAKALSQYNSDLASTEYGNAYNRYNADQNSLFNRLATLSGYGQTAGTQQTAAGQNYANTSGQLTTNLANAQIAAQQAAASRPSMFSQLLGAGTQLGSAYLMGGKKT